MSDYRRAMRPETDQTTGLLARGPDADLAARVARLEALLYPSDRGVPVTVAASKLGVHRNTVLNWIRQGRAPATKWAGEWELDPRWLAATLALRGRV